MTCFIQLFHLIFGLSFRTSWRTLIRSITAHTHNGLKKRERRSNYPIMISARGVEVINPWPVSLCHYLAIDIRLEISSAGDFP